ncbi:hypothetical protein WA171_000745 [Blastocystis sp. BT1]
MSTDQEDGEIVMKFDINSVKLKQSASSPKATTTNPIPSKREGTGDSKGEMDVMKEILTIADSGLNPRPVLPIVPSTLSNNYNWKMWNEWYSALSIPEREPLRNRRINRLFSLLITRSPQQPLVFACLMPSNGPVLLHQTLQLTPNEMALLTHIPILQGITLETLPTATLAQFAQQCKEILSPPQGSNIITVLLCFSVHRSLLEALEFHLIPQLVIRDVGRTPIHRPSLHIPQSLHSLFVSPSTPITLRDPFALLTRYLNPLHLTCKWINIPIPSQPSLHWVRYEILQGSRLCLIGYCIVRNSENNQREAFAVLRHLWGQAPPLLYRGPPSRQELEYLDHFLRCVCGTASFSLPQTTALLPLLFRSIEKEVDYALQNFASQEAVINASVAPTVGISSSSVTPTITSLPAIKEPFIESSNEPSLSSQKRTQPAMISLPDLSLDGDAQLILIIDLDLTLVHAIHDDDAISIFNQWMSSVKDDSWIREIQAQLNSLELFYIDDNGSSRFSNLLIKTRPGIITLLHELAARYELIIYTQGEVQYAEQVMKLLDPDDSLFKGRFIARGEAQEEPQKKLLSKILDCWNTYVKEHTGYDPSNPSSELSRCVLTQSELEQRLLILDDKDDVWELTGSEEKSNPIDHLVKCLPYFFFDNKGRYDLQRLQMCERLESDYVRRLTGIFAEVHTRWQRQGGRVMEALRSTRRSVLRGLRIAFSSIIEQSEGVENNLLYQLLVEYGGAYVTDLTNCDLLVCRQLRTAKVNQAQLNHVPVVSIRWLEECVKYWRLAPLEPFYLDFKQDLQQTALLGKEAVDSYHIQAKNVADTHLFTVTEPPPAYQALRQNEPKDSQLIDYDQLILNELQQASPPSKQLRLSPELLGSSEAQFSPPVIPPSQKSIV